MAAREERLSGATRNYVIFGLLLLGALALAAREHFGPHSGTGMADSAIRLMLVGGSPSTASALDEVDGFSVWQIGVAEAVAGGRVALDDDDAPDLAAAIAYADQQGFGFLALACFDAAGEAIDWQLGDESPPDAVPFVVYSVGDLAPEGPRMEWFEPAPLHLDPLLAELDSVRLALYDHPDLQALWQTDPPVVQLQAREVLRSRGIDERRATLLADQTRWRELADIWPAPGVIPGSLAGAWEHVRAAPIRGGVLIEVREVEPLVTIYRKPTLSIGADAWLWFVPREALSFAEPDTSEARQRCAGLPERISGDIAIAPDGSSLVLRETDGAPAQVFVFDEAAAAAGRCTAQLRATSSRGDRVLGRTSGAGMMAWAYSDHRLSWYTPDGTPHNVEVPAAQAYSGPWWLDDTLLALIGEPPLPPEVSPSLDGVQPSVFLFDTATPESPPRALDTRALFGLPPGVTVDDAEALIELRPAGEHELLVLTEGCRVDADAASQRPCLHRLHSELPWREWLATPPEQAPPIRLETLGPLGPHHELAIAADGSRALWIDAKDNLLSYIDLRGAKAHEPQRVHADLLRDSDVRISADGQVVTSSVSLSLDELGSVSISRAAVLVAPAGEIPTSPSTSD